MFWIKLKPDKKILNSSPVSRINEIINMKQQHKTAFLTYSQCICISRVELILFPVPIVNIGYIVLCSNVNSGTRQIS